MGDVLRRDEADRGHGYCSRPTRRVCDRRTSDRGRIAARGPHQPTRPGIHSFWLARTQLDQGKVEQACHTATQALEPASAVGSERVSCHLREFYDQLATQAGARSPGLRGTATGTPPPVTGSLSSMSRYSSRRASRCSRLASVDHARTSERGIHSMRSDSFFSVAVRRR